MDYRRDPEKLFTGIVLIAVGIIFIPIIIGFFIIWYGLQYIDDSKFIKTRTPPSSDETSTNISTSTKFVRSPIYKLNNQKNNFDFKLIISEDYMANHRNKIFELQIVVFQSVLLLGNVTNFPILTTSRKYISDDSYSFLITKKGNLSEFGDFEISVSNSELVRVTKNFGFSRDSVQSIMVLGINFESIDQSLKAIEKIERLNINVNQSISEEKHSLTYGMTKYIDAAFSIAYSDGHYASKEKNEILEFINEHGEDDKYQLRQYVNSLTSSNVVPLYKSINEIKQSIGALRLLTKGLGLLVNVASSDGRLEEKERELLDYFVKSFDIDREIYNEMIRKYISQTDDIELSLDFLGIDKALPDAKKRHLLNMAYLEWNKKMISNNPEVKERAIKVIEFISEERAKLKKHDKS